MLVLVSRVVTTYSGFAILPVDAASQYDNQSLPPRNRSYNIYIGLSSSVDLSLCLYIVSICCGGGGRSQYRSIVAATSCHSTPDTRSASVHMHTKYTRSGLELDQCSALSWIVYTNNMCMQCNIIWSQNQQRQIYTIACRMSSAKTMRRLKKPTCHPAGRDRRKSQERRKRKSTFWLCFLSETERKARPKCSGWLALSIDVFNSL